jgi:hypothetical protein
MIRRALMLATCALAGSVALGAAKKLRLNPHLDFASDSQDGPLITGDRMDEWLAKGEPNHIIFSGEG